MAIRPIPEATPQSSQALADGFISCADAVRAAARALLANCPHARNYPGRHADAFHGDSLEWQKRIEALKNMAEQLSREADLVDYPVAGS